MTSTTKTHNERNGLFQGIVGLLSTRAAVAALSQGFTTLKRSWPSLLQSGIRVFNSLNVASPSRAAVEKQVVTSSAAVNAVTSTEEAARLRAELAAVRGVNREREVRAELSAIPRQGDSEPDLLEQEVRFCLSLDFEKQKQFLEIRKNQAALQRLLGGGF